LNVKKTALFHLLVTVAGLAMAALPISVLAAPDDFTHQVEARLRFGLSFRPGGEKGLDRLLDLN